jgi:hypothetical protein
MFETHSQPTNGHFLTELAESFTGAIIKEIGIHSPVGWMTKRNLPAKHKFNAITNLTIAFNTEISTILGIYNRCSAF